MAWHLINSAQANSINIQVPETARVYYYKGQDDSKALHEANRVIVFNRVNDNHNLIVNYYYKNDWTNEAWMEHDANYPVVSLTAPNFIPIMTQITSFLNDAVLRVPQCYSLLPLFRKGINEAEEYLPQDAVIPMTAALFQALEAAATAAFNGSSFSPSGLR